MAKFCGKCGSRLDEATGLCPRCDQPQQKKKQKPVKAKKKRSFWKTFGILLLILALMAGLLLALMYFAIIPTPDWLPIPGRTEEGVISVSEPPETTAETAEAEATEETVSETLPETEPPTLPEPEETLPPTLTVETAELTPAQNPITKITVSCATYNNDRADHNVNNLLDGNLKTNWTEGVEGLGEGEYLEFQFGKVLQLDYITIHSGNHYSQQRYQDNARPEKLTLSFSDGYSETFIMRDSMETQILDIPGSVNTDFVRITFDSVIPGAKYEDTVLSEIDFAVYEVAETVTQVPSAGGSCTKIRFERCYDDSGSLHREQAVCYGFDAAGTRLWSYETSQYDMKGLHAVSLIGVQEDILYLSENGTVVALNVQDGSVVWQNGGFFGYPTAYALDDSGRLYLCGYQSPDLFIIDAQGNTVLRVEQFDSQYYWPSQLTIEDGNVLIKMDGHPEDIPPESSVITLNLAGYDYTLPQPVGGH